MNKQKQTICIGIVKNEQQDYLICQRQAGQHLAGKWEFPGGKVEQDEQLEQTLVRELEEEVGITALTYQHFESLSFDYDDLALNLHFFVVTEFSGEAQSCEGQQLAWIKAAQFSEYTFPKANRTIINKLLESA